MLKFKLTIIKDDGEVEKYYKSLSDIAKVLNIPYHHVRWIYLNSTCPKKYLHPTLKQLSQKIKIDPIEQTLNLNI